jgi:hypothetical protein
VGPAAAAGSAVSARSSQSANPRPRGLTPMRFSWRADRMARRVSRSAARYRGRPGGGTVASVAAGRAPSCRRLWGDCPGKRLPATRCSQSMTHSGPTHDTTLRRQPGDLLTRITHPTLLDEALVSRVGDSLTWAAAHRLLGNARRGSDLAHPRRRRRVVAHRPDPYRRKAAAAASPPSRTSHLTHGTYSGVRFSRTKADAATYQPGQGEPQQLTHRWCMSSRSNREAAT